MKTVGTVLLLLLVRGTSRLAAQIPPASTPNPVYARLQQDEAAAADRAEKSGHKPCVNLVAIPASEEDDAAFRAILNAAHSNMEILLYVSHDPIVKNHGGAMSFRCEVENHDIYEAYENWTIYDPDLIQGDAARDFVFAHEIAHHMNGDTSSDRPRSKQVELLADSDGAKYLLQMGWNEARLEHALDLLNLPQSPQVGYPTLEERKAIVEGAATLPPPAPPTGLWGRVTPPPPYEKLLDMLQNLKFQGTISLQSLRTNRYVCAKGASDPKIPPIEHFSFFDNCGLDQSAQFDLRIDTNDGSGYWIQQPAVPCPKYAAICQYVLESVGDQLQFWNQNLAADRYGWEKELGEQEVFSFEASGRPEGLVWIKSHSGGYIFVDPKTAKLRTGGSREQAAEFKIVFDSN